MNWEYLHLITNPFAIVLPIVGGVVGVAGWLAGHEDLERWGVVAVLLGGAAAVPSYFSGIAAADDVSQRIFITPSAVQTHRTWATWAAVLLVTCAIFAGYSLAQPRERRLRRFVLLCALAASALTAFAAWRGGMIEHRDLGRDGEAEARAPAPAAGEATRGKAATHGGPAPGEAATPGAAIRNPAAAPNEEDFRE